MASKWRVVRSCVRSSLFQREIFSCPLPIVKQACQASTLIGREKIHKPAGLVNVDEISTLEEWNAKKEEVKAYRKMRLEMKNKKIADGRPYRPRLALKEREAFLAERALQRKELETEREKSGLDWEYKAAVLFERLPVIIPEPEDWEIAWMDFENKLRWESGREWPRELEVWQDDMDSPAPSFMEQYENCPIPLAPRITEADKTNDRTSLDRCLDQRVFHIYRDGPSKPWKFLHSTVRRDKGETLRACAERVMIEALLPQEQQASKNHFSYWHVGNCASGYQWKIYSDEERQRFNAFGEQIFHMRCQIIRGEPLFAIPGVERLWVSKNELGEYFGPQLGDYYKLIL